MRGPSRRGRRCRARPSGWRSRATPRAGRGSMSRLVATAKLFRGGGLPWLRVARDGLAAIRVAVGAAGLSTGVLECLGDGPVDAASVRAQLRLDDDGLLEPWLRVLQGHGLVRASAGGGALTRRGRRLLGDGVVRGPYEGVAGLHT